jgi:hypothetical protein
MAVHYDLYVDETFPRGQVAVAFGAVRCSPERTVRVLRDLARLRADAGHSSEMCGGLRVWEVLYSSDGP